MQSKYRVCLSAAGDGLKHQALRLHPLSEALRSSSPTDDIIRWGGFAVRRSKPQAGDGLLSCWCAEESEKGVCARLSLPVRPFPLPKHLHGSSVRERRRPPASDSFRPVGEHLVVFVFPTRLNVWHEKREGRQRRLASAWSRCSFETNTTPLSSEERACMRASHGCWQLRGRVSSSVMAVSASEPLCLPCAYHGALKGECRLVVFIAASLHRWTRSPTCTPRGPDHSPLRPRTLGPPKSMKREGSSHCLFYHAVLSWRQPGGCALLLSFCPSVSA